MLNSIMFAMALASTTGMSPVSDLGPGGVSSACNLAKVDGGIKLGMTESEVQRQLKSKRRLPGMRANSGGSSWSILHHEKSGLEFTFANGKLTEMKKRK